MLPSVKAFGFQMPKICLDFLTRILEVIFLKMFVSAVSRLAQNRSIKPGC
jgi:hypothetical protein